MLNAIEGFLKINKAHEDRFLELFAFLEKDIHAEESLSHPHSPTKAKLCVAEDAVTSIMNPALNNTEKNLQGVAHQTNESAHPPGLLFFGNGMNVDCGHPEGIRPVS